MLSLSAQSRALTDATPPPTRARARMHAKPSINPEGNRGQAAMGTQPLNTHIEGLAQRMTVCTTGRFCGRDCFLFVVNTKTATPKQALFSGKARFDFGSHIGPSGLTTSS